MEKVLLCIKDYQTIRAFSSFLSDDYEVDVASNEVDSINYLQENQYSLILIDFTPLSFNGQSVLDYMQKSNQISNQPVSIILDTTNLQQELDLFNMGCAELFHKPFDSIVTRKRIQNVITIFTLKKNVSDYEQKLVTDPLTGLLNRDGFESNVRKVIKTKAPGAFIMCDLDGLKFINDNYTHQVGDNIIQGVGRTLTKTMPKDSLIAHVSGDEFCVYINNEKDEEVIASYCENFQKTLLSSVLLPDVSRPVTASLGIAVFPTVASTYENLHTKADHAMLYVKNHGKNAYKFHAPRDDREELLKGRQECTKVPMSLMLKEREGEEIQTWLKFGEFRIVYIVYQKYSKDKVDARKCQLNIIDKTNPENPDPKKINSLHEKISTFIKESQLPGIFSWYSINQLMILAIERETIPRGLGRLKQELANEMNVLNLDIELKDN